MGKRLRGGAVPSAPLFLAFALSGAAGLTYELLWSRYLTLFVGSSAYAQVLVLAVYLGGMGVGALAISDGSRRLRNPLLWYAGAELVLAAAGLAFDPLFRTVTAVSYDTLFPALGSAGAVGALRWGLAMMLIFPQAVVLGLTFSFMEAGLVRGRVDRAGLQVADVYLANTFGGAVGVVAAGFALVPAFGLPGALAGAAIMNVAAAAMTGITARGAAPAPVAAAPVAEAPEGAPGISGESLWRLLLGVSFFTALASFAYEIGWIRMLSLVLGSATHSFELMLSAFLLGLALGSALIREQVDRADAPLRLLGGVQWIMGLDALATLPLYLGSYDAMAHLVGDLAGTETGYFAFNAARYGLVLVVMLPATVMAGMTLPIITGTLVRAGAGERALGWVYGANTLGSVVGAVLAGLVALPVLGLKGLIVAGAAVDMALGVVLLLRWTRARGRAPGRARAMGAAGVGVCGVVAWGLTLDPIVLTSGVFWYGIVPSAEARDVLFYADGRTATVGVHCLRDDRLTVLSTNGKPDASLDARWFDPARAERSPRAIGEGLDVTTQMLAPLVGLAFHPGKVSVANIGHGSGVSGAAFLASGRVRRLVTIEIEPEVVEASRVFALVNHSVFEDPRSTFVFDDAKSYFAYRKERFDVIFSEPSNPWVSGVADLFTAEFYRRLRHYLADDGVLVQWYQLYETNDDLVLSVLAALRESFPVYRAYLVGDGDLVIVAPASGTFSGPDWSVMDAPGVRRMLAGVPPFRPEHLDALLVLDQNTFRPLFDGRVPVNSDFHPFVDTQSERARLTGEFADGVYSVVANRFDLQRAIEARRMMPWRAYRPLPARGLEPLVEAGQAAWLHDVLRARGGEAPEDFPEWTDELLVLRDFFAQLRDTAAPRDWPAWTSAFDRVERDLHWKTAGWADTVFYDAVGAYLARTKPPPEVQAAVSFQHGIAAWDWTEAAGAADALVPVVAAGRRWVRPTVLLDGAVVAYLKTGQAARARHAYDVLAPHTGRASWNARNRLLDALIREATVQDADGHPSGG